MHFRIKKSVYLFFKAAVVTISLLLGASEVLAEVGFRDLLEVPAVKSSLVTKSLLSGIARAGDRVICVGQRGHIIYSDDQGKSWVQSEVPVSTDLIAVQFVTARQGWAVGHDGVVLHSSDGGETWEKQLDGFGILEIIKNYYHKDFAPQMTDRSRFMREVNNHISDGAYKSLLDLWFKNETTGYIIGAFNLILRTNDGGKSWVPVMDRVENPRSRHLYSIRPAAKELFIVGEQGLLLKFNLELDSFNAIESPYRGSFFGVTGKDKFVLVYGLRGNIYRSLNKGESWQKVESGVSTGLVDSTATDDGRILIAGLDGTLLESKDGGASFIPLAKEKAEHTSAVEVAGANSLVVTGFNGIRLEPM